MKYQRSVYPAICVGNPSTSSQRKVLWRVLPYYEVAMVVRNFHGKEKREHHSDFAHSSYKNGDDTTKQNTVHILICIVHASHSRYRSGCTRVRTRVHLLRNLLCDVLSSNISYARIPRNLEGAKYELRNVQPPSSLTSTSAALLSRAGRISERHEYFAKNPEAMRLVVTRLRAHWIEVLYATGAHQSLTNWNRDYWGVPHNPHLLSV